MKYLYILFLVFPFYISSQTWEFKNAYNDFDGAFKVASQIASIGTNSIYKPRLVINSVNDGLTTNFYITDYGLVFDDLSVWLKFDNDDILYYARTTLSDDGKTIFIRDARDDDDDIFSKLELYKKLESASRISIRVQDKYSKNDYRFSLKGSSKAINQVVDFNSQIENIKLAKKLKEDTDSKVKVFMNEIINLKIRFSSWRIIRNIFESEFRQAILDGTINNYESVTLKEHPIEKNKRDYQVKVFYKMKDGSEKEFTGRYFTVEKDAPIYKRFYDEENKLKNEKNIKIERMFDIIDKIKFSVFSIERVKRNIKAKIEYNNTDWTYDSIYVVPCNCELFETFGKVDLFFSEVNNLTGLRQNININGEWNISEESPQRKKLLKEIEYFNSLVPNNVLSDLTIDRRNFVSNKGDIYSIQSIYLNKKRGSLSKSVYRNNGRELYVKFKDGKSSLLSKYVKIE